MPSNDVMLKDVDSWALSFLSGNNWNGVFKMGTERMKWLTMYKSISQNIFPSPCKYVPRGC